MGKIWSKLSSIKFAIFLFTLIILSAIIGTLIIQQNEDLELLKHKYGVFFSVFAFLGFFDLYHSWWFTCLLFLLFLNILACSIQRFSVTYRQITQPPVDVSRDFLLKCAHNKTLKLTQEENKVRAKIVNFLKQKGFSVKEGKTTILGHKGAIAKWGVFISHISVLLILLGAIYGGVFGFKGVVHIIEGESAAEFNLRKTNKLAPLNFSIFLEKFTVEFYQNSNTPKSFISFVKLTDPSGKEAPLTGKIEVNHPIKYKDISLYQLNYGVAAELAKVTVKITNQKKVVSQHSIATGQEFNLENTSYKIKLLQFIPDFGMDANMQIYSKSNEPNNPAILIEVINKDKPEKRFWIFQKFPDFHKSPDLPFKVEFVDFQQPFYSGLEVVKDPGVPIIYLGFTVLILGLFFSLNLYYRRIWFNIDGKICTIGVSAQKDLLVKEEFNKITTGVEKIMLNA